MGRGTKGRGLLRGRIMYMNGHNTRNRTAEECLTAHDRCMGAAKVMLPSHCAIPFWRSLPALRKATSWTISKQQDEAHEWFTMLNSGYIPVTLHMHQCYEVSLCKVKLEAHLFQNKPGQPSITPGAVF